MNVDRLAGECPDGWNCATIATTDRGTVVVAGYRLPTAELATLNLPEGETAVEIPLSVFAEAAHAHRR